MACIGCRSRACFWRSSIKTIRCQTLTQLNGPVVNTPNIRLYDYVLGQTDTVAQISGGNSGLKADDRHVFKLGTTWDAIDNPKTKLNFTASYIDSVTRNAIGSLTTATSAIEAAFPDQFERNDDDELIEVDDRAVNFYQEARRDLRWGFNFTKVLREPTRPPRPPGARPPYGFRQRQANRMEGQSNEQANTPGNGATAAQGVGQGNSQDNHLAVNAQHNTQCGPQGDATAKAPVTDKSTRRAASAAMRRTRRPKVAWQALRYSTPAPPPTPRTRIVWRRLWLTAPRNKHQSTFGPPGGGRGFGGPGVVARAQAHAPALWAVVRQTGRPGRSGRRWWTCAGGGGFRQWQWCPARRIAQHTGLLTPCA